MRRLLVLIVGMTLILSACAPATRLTSAPTTSVALPPSATSAPTAALITTPALTTTQPPDLDPTVSVIEAGLLPSKQALEAMYGQEALAISDTEALLPAPTPGYTTTVRINLMACFWENLAEKCLVITESAFGNCHACQADIDGAVFQRVNGSWELIVFQRGITSLGSFGDVPEGALIRIGPDKHAALIRSGWAGQEYAGEYATMIAEVDGGLRVILNVLVGELQESFTDAMTSFEWGYGSKIEFSANGGSDFYDLVVTQYGINMEGEKFKTVSLYRFSAEVGEYVLVDQR